MHDECLTGEAKRLFPRLANFRGYHLVGGTALALQIGHRVSYDFDLFTEHALAPNLHAKVKKVFYGERVKPVFRMTEQYDIFVSDIKTTFRYYPYPPVHPLKKHHGVPVLSIKDIGASKTFEIGQRAAYRDYVDVFIYTQ
ncbi:nucleotidyl transferase AbiEii/AbiGii toxin family protein [Candidatus Uhrbacteria bacterium]|nr:nucleotidyl transferase AbiEii/AbiGii toxin family protein [Candidatus Uhrbacteria bacterium]